ncbi:MAG TPA: DinB family protein [Desulfomonilaceae bacterium]|nr:DinB family protein [Desulfomonilaceae bacterium]
MHTPQAAELSELIHQKVAEFKEVCEGLDEETASLAPSGRWSPKEIVSHLCGPEGVGHMPTINAIMEEDTPLLEIEVENPFFSEDRARRTFAELLAEFDREYDRVAEFVADLSQEQLSRKAHIPFLKETPFGEYPSLGVWIQVIGKYHLDSHIEHMKEILETLGVKSGMPRKPVGQEAHATSPPTL